MIKKLSLIIFFMISIFSYAFNQNINKKDSTSVYYYYQKDFSSDTMKLNIVDTILDDFQRYDALSKRGKFYASLGNIGLASRNLVFDNNKIFGFDFGIHSYDTYLFNSNNIKYYQLLSPFTNIFFSQGGKNEKKEQNFRIIHSQQIRRGLTIGIKGNIINSFGNYKNQKAKNSNVGVIVSYFTKNKKYGVLGNFIHNSLENAENGGIKYDSVFEKNIETDRKLITVNLDKAENRLIGNSFFFKQYYKFNRKQDSVNRQKKSHLISTMFHSFNYNNQSLRYTDDEPGVTFYPAIIKDSLYTYDKIKIKSYDNKITFQNLFERQKIIILSLSLILEHKYLELSEYSDAENYKTRYFIQYIPSSDISLYFYKTNTLINNQLKYLFGDYNDKDISIKNEINQFLSKKQKNKFILKLNYTRQEVPYFYNIYNSNHYEWANNFNKINTFLSNISFKNKIIETGIEYYNIKNFVYLNNKGVPGQYNNKLSVIKAYLYNNFKIGKVNFSNSIIYQNISENDILRLPKILAKVSLSYNQDFFKGHLSTQTGVDINYHSSYYANAYSPALSSFYLQDEKEIRDYVYIDLFLNFKIKRTRFFIKYQHINQGMFGYNYYSVPHYPLQDRIIKYGISWRFNN